MEDILTQISRLKRPTLLVRTARHGIEDYNRVLHLRRLLRTEKLPGPGKAIIALMEIEAWSPHSAVTAVPTILWHVTLN